ncbi:hypothetical protein DOV11_04125 [Salmonella enterica]|nr:DUF551 domain-containing protein [Salmonella enterica]EAU0855617.1 hypothetical protein [Salmonella enterica]
MPSNLRELIAEEIGILFSDDDAQSVWNACRAAMLQAGNHTEQHLDMVGRSGDANQKVDFRLPFAQWLSQQNEPIDVDCGCVTTEAFYHWLRVAYEAGNSPVTPDCWIPVSERMPEKGVDVLACKINPFGGYDEIEAAQWYGGMKGEQPVFITSADTIEPEMWQTLPAAPREVG